MAQPSTTSMSQADAAAIVIRDAGHPLHRREIAERIVERGFDVWSGDGPGRTPWESVGRAITQEMVLLGDEARFEYERKGSGTYRLKAGVTVTGGGQVPAASKARCVLSIELDPQSLRFVDAARATRGLSREDFVLKVLKRRLWELDMEQAEEEWRRSYADSGGDVAELDRWATIRASPGPWEPRNR